MALPRKWRNTITRAAPENSANVLNVKIVLDGKAVLLKDLKTKTVYNTFVKGILKSPTAQESICIKLMSQSIPSGYIPPGNPRGLAQRNLPGGSGFDF